MYKQEGHADIAEKPRDDFVLFKCRYVLKAHIKCQLSLCKSVHTHYILPFCTSY